MAFAESGAYEPRQYLKPKQTYRLRNSKGLSVSEIRTRIEEMMTEKPKWKLKVNEGLSLFALKFETLSDLRMLPLYIGIQMAGLLPVDPSGKSTS